MTFGIISTIFAAWENEGSGEKFESLCNLIKELGLPLNDKKVEPPSEEMTIMGIVISIPNKIIAIPGEKMEEIKQACDEAWHRRLFTKRQLQSLLGKLH